MSDGEVNRLMRDLEAEAEAGGYHLNPDREFTCDLVRGLLANRERYGYISCPCRLASGNRDDDLDIICPCDYRDPDLADYGACYCALYVATDVKSAERTADPVPERRPPPAERRQQRAERTIVPGTLNYPVRRCRVCGYLCARDEPPAICLICRVFRGRFERFMESRSRQA
ncbi:MAG: ferredoxin-thioredoxin reductase catalytic domain-containing protein [Methanoculleus sp.]